MASGFPPSEWIRERAALAGARRWCEIGRLQCGSPPLQLRRPCAGGKKKPSPAICEIRKSLCLSSVQIPDFLSRGPGRCVAGVGGCPISCRDASADVVPCSVRPPPAPRRANWRSLPWLDHPARRIQILFSGRQCGIGGAALPVCLKIRFLYGALLVRQLWYRLRLGRRPAGASWKHGNVLRLRISIDYETNHWHLSII